MGIENDLIKYSKEKFHKDVKEWINNQTKFLLTENWGEDSYFTTVLKGSDCRISEDSFSFWQPCFSLELFNDDYEIFIDKDFDFSIFKYPVYYVFIKNKDKNIDLKGSNITIEVI